MKKTILFTLLLFCFCKGYAQTPWLHVDSNKIKDPAGNAVVLRGLSFPDVTSATPGSGMTWFSLINKVTNISDTTPGTTNAPGSPGWYPKVLRLPVYFMDTSKFQSYYTNTLKPLVDSITAKGLYVIIDNHGVDVDVDASVDDYTQAFWAFFAPKFKDNPAVLYEAYNEPVNQSWSWNVYKPYMQNWINIIRERAPHNLILAGSPNYSRNVGGAENSPFSGGNIVYVVHIYPLHWRGNDQSIAATERIATKYPVFFTEWGFGANDQNSSLLKGTITDYGKPFTDWVEQLGGSWTAWVADDDWEPNMFQSGNWNLLIAENEMGGFTKDLLYDKRNQDLPSDVPCAAPYLGLNQSLCETPSVTLDAHLNADGKTFTWYKNDTIIPGANTATLANVTAKGIYKVTVDTTGCTMAASVEIVDALRPVSLGPDIAIVDSAMLTVTGFPIGSTFEWYKNASLLANADTSFLKVKDTVGTVFVVKVSTATCGFITDTLKVVPVKGSFKGTLLTIPGKIEAEYFDFQNLPGLSYSDTDPTNHGGQFRNEEVDVESCYDSGSGYDIGWIEGDEWVNYSIKVETPGTYDISFRIASPSGQSGKFSLSVNGEQRTDTLLVPNTTTDPDGWQAWDNFLAFSVPFYETDSVITIHFVNGGFNLNYFEITALSSGILGKSSQNSNIKIFPNPAKDIVYLQTEEKEVSYRIISMLGTEVLSGKGKKVNIAELQKGTYMIIVNGQAVQIIKQ